MYAVNSNTNTDTRCNKSASAGRSQESGETIKRPILLLTPEGIPIVQPAPKRPRPSVYGGSIGSIYAGSALNGAVEYLPAADDGSAGSVSVAHPDSGDHIVLQQYTSREDRIDGTAISTHAEDNGGEDDAARTFVENGYGFHGREILQPRSVLAHTAQHCRPQISTETSLLAENIKDAFVVTDDNDDSRSVETAGTAETACGSNASPRRRNSSDKHSYHHIYQQQLVQEREQAGMNYAEHGGSALAEAHSHTHTRVLGFGFGISNGDKACSGGGDEVEKMSKRIVDGDGEKGSGGGISGGSAANQDKNGSDNEQEADDGMVGRNNANNSGSDEEEDEEEEGNEGEEGDDNGEDEDEDDEYLEETRDCDVEGTVEEMGELEQLIPGLAEQYRLLGKIGEGTFSTVYKAIDLQHEKYENSSWTMIFRDEARSLDSSDTLLASGEETSDNDNEIDIGIGRAEEGPRGMRGGRRQRGESAGFRRRARVVAIKKIYVTSSPKRIANEISILDDLKGSKFIAPLVTAMRREDQVVVVLPYFRNDDFRRFYLDLPVDEMRWYFASLMSGLQYAHSKGIMHRDIKPSNFLYDVRRRHGVLVDFGLAERENDQEASRLRSRHALQMDSSTAMRLFRSVDQRGRPGVPRKDTRPGLRANRAGTRGFRAPEVLLKVPQQSVAIDVWSVGVILLCFLTRRFPFFQSIDDTEALLEISVLFGRLEMERVSAELSRTFLTNIPTVKDRGIRFESLAKAYNTDGYPCIPPDAFDLLRRMLTLNPDRRITAEEALAHPFVARRKTQQTAGASST